MELSNYLRGVKDGVENAAALADDNTKQVATRLASSVESSVQLALIEALSDATTEISAELAPGSVGMTMQGLTPHFSVTLPEATGEATYLEPESSAEDEAEVADVSDEDDADDTLVRFSLRLPKWAKDKADKRAAEEGVSTNTWLAERVIRELSSRRRHDGPRHDGPRHDGPRRGPGPFGPPPPPPFGPGPGRGPRDRRGGRGWDDREASDFRQDGGPRGRGPKGRGPRHGHHDDQGTAGPGPFGRDGFDSADISAMIDMAGKALRDWTGDGRGRGHRGGRGGNVQGWV